MSAIIEYYPTMPDKEHLFWCGIAGNFKLFPPSRAFWEDHDDTLGRLDKIACRVGVKIVSVALVPR